MKYLTQQTNAVRWEIISNLHSVLLFSLNAVMMLVSCDVMCILVLMWILIFRLHLVLYCIFNNIFNNTLNDLELNSGCRSHLDCLNIYFQWCHLWIKAVWATLSVCYIAVWIDVPLNQHILSFFPLLWWVHATKLWLTKRICYLKSKDNEICSQSYVGLRHERKGTTIVY